MIAFFANIFGYVLNYIYILVKNYGLAIIIFSILIKMLMIPISIKQQKTMKKSTKIQKKMKEIQFKYKNNPEQLNQATMELYKSENMSPFSGCFSAIAQIILLFAVFYLVRSPLTYMKKVDDDVVNKYTKIIKENDLSTNSAYPQIEIIREIENIRNLKNNNISDSSEEQNIDLSEINDDELDSLYINMDFLGLNLAQVPTRSSDWKAYIIPILYVVVSIISMRITNPTKKSKKQEKPEENEDEKSLTKPEDDFDPMAQMNKNMNKILDKLVATTSDKKFDNEDVSKEIRTEQISMSASLISKLSGVREILVAEQRKMALDKGYIMDGRDIGTVVLKDAEVKIFLTASVEARAKRRYLQDKEAGMDVSLEVLKEEIEKRDYQDTHREVSPLKKAEDAIVVDSSDLSIDEVVSEILDIINKKVME